MTGSVIRGRASRTPLPNARDTARPYLNPVPNKKGREPRDFSPTPGL